MATKKDLVEAYSFSRRRLVTAFVSGAPGGREVEPARPGRTIIGGLALAVLLVAGAAIAGIFSPSVADDWADQPGLIVSKEKAAVYVITEDSEDAEGTGPVLRPVINTTSAMLILGADVTPEIIPQASIDDETIGDEIGILNAPASVPSPALLIDTGWTACTNEGRGTRVRLSATPGATVVEDGGFVVRRGGRFYVIAQEMDQGVERPRAHSYELPSGGGRDDRARDTMLTELGLPPSVDAMPVSQEWLALFPTGGELAFDSFQTDDGGTLPYVGDASGIPPTLEAGDVVTDDGNAFLLTPGGPAPLSDFAFAVYQSLPRPHTPKVRPADGSLSAEQAERTYLEANWPESTLAPVPGEACALLQPEAGSRPAVQIAADPEEPASAYDTAGGNRSVTVDQGRGAFVISGGWNDTTEGSPYFLDPKGAYPIEGSDTPDYLGYGSYDAPVVPDTWIELFDQRVTLSRQQALCPPGNETGRTCD